MTLLLQAIALLITTVFINACGKSKVASLLQNANLSEKSRTMSNFVFPYPV